MTHIYSRWRLILHGSISMVDHDEVGPDGSYKQEFQNTLDQEFLFADFVIVVICILLTIRIGWLSEADIHLVVVV